MDAPSRMLRVKRFWEKPVRDVAQSLFDRGCLWNTFVMVGRAAEFLSLIQSATPRLHEVFQDAFSSGNADADQSVIRTLYEKIETADFSKQILSAGVDRLIVLSFKDVGWNDLGEPDRVNAVLGRSRLRKPAGKMTTEVMPSVAISG